MSTIIRYDNPSATKSNPPSKGHGPNGKRNVLISFLSYDQDDFEYKKQDDSFMNSFLLPGGKPRNRHEIWRPSVALAQLHGLDSPYPDLIFDDYYLLWDEKENHRRVKEEVEADIRAAMPGHGRGLHVENPGITQAWDTKDVFRHLFGFLSREEFHDPDASYYVNCANGTTAIRNCLFLFTQTGQITASRIAPIPWENHKQRDKKKDEKGEYARDGRRTAKGCYTTEDPFEFNEAYATIDDKENNKTVQILKRGVITRNLTLLKEIAAVVNKIKNIPKPDFRIKQTILITGETGVGKTQLAQNIACALGLVDNHQKANFVHINCAHICGADPNIPRIELFGSTGEIGSVGKTEGALAKANHGMLFLDEIGELPSDMQALLLTALDNGEYIPLGGDYSQPRKSSFQLVCGTNQPLEELVATGKFRLDLLNRINAWHFELPPLRDRPDDIELNIKSMASIIGEKCRGQVVQFTQEAESELIKFAQSREISWDGNFRELNAMITHMVVLSNGLSITKDIVVREIEAIRRKYRNAEKLKAKIEKEKRDRGLRYVVLQEVPPAIEKAPVEPPSESESPLVHVLKTGIAPEAYEKLPQLSKYEFELLARAVYRDHIVQKDDLCRAVYGDSIKSKSLFNHLKALNLNFSRGRLTYTNANPRTAS